MVTTIQILEPTKEKLNSLKHSKRETYEEVIRELIELVEEDKMELSGETKKILKIARKEKGISTKQLIKEMGI